MAKKYYDDPINKYVDWGGDESTQNLPVTGKRVQQFIHEALDSKAGFIHHDHDSNMYFAFADQDTYAEWQASVEDPTQQPKDELILFRFMAPERFSATIELTGSTQQQTIVKSGTTNNVITYMYDVIDSTSSQSVGSTANVSYKIQNGGNTQTLYVTTAAKTDTALLLDSYLKSGMNRIQITVTDQATNAQATMSLTYYVIDMDVSSQFDNLQPVTADIMQVSVTATGDSAKHFEFFIDGEQVIPLEGDIAVTAYSGTAIADIDVSAYANGKHSLQIRIYIIQNYSRLYSDVLYYDFIKNTSPLAEFLMTFNIDQKFGIVTDQHPYVLPAKQYAEATFNWTLYYHTLKTIDVTLDYDEGVNRLKVEPGHVENFSHYYGETGEKTITFTAEGNTYSLPVLVSETDLGFQEATSGLILKLTADSRSNEDANYNQWTYGDYSTTFTGFRWNTVSGWGHNQLNIEKGSHITIDCYPFRGKSSTELSHFGATVEIVFELNNVDDDEAVIARVNNGSDKAGVIVKATEASLYMDGDIVGVNTKYNPRGRRMLTFIVNRNATTIDKNILYIVNNGVVERSTTFSAADSIDINQPIVIGSDQADVILHSVRVYSDAISVEDALANYVIMSPDMLSIAYRNRVLDNGIVSYELVKNLIPTFKITCLEGYNMDIINNATTKKANIRADVEYTNPFDNTLNFTIKTAYICPQGTSSLSYPIKNLRLYTQTKKEPNCKLYDAEGNEVADNKYAFRHGSQPVDCWTLKADYAESSMSHNTGTAKLWNDSLKSMKVNLGTQGDVYVCRTRAQQAAIDNKYAYDVRTAIDGFPCVVFYQNSA